MKKQLFSIPLNPLWLLIALAPLPFFYFSYQCVSKWQALAQLEEEFQRVQKKSSHLRLVQQNEKSLHAALKDPDPHYLDKYVETLTFLLPEIKKLEALQTENLGDEQLLQRLHFLKEGQNRLVFTEEKIRSNNIFQEVEEKQQSAIELNEEDLKKMLCLIEGVTIWPYGPKEGRPQLIIKDFKLTKKEISSQEKVYVATMQLIKRENVETRK